MSDEIVEQVLFEWYGLSRLEDLLAGKKPKGEGIRDFLGGTVLGTFVPSKEGMPLPPKIYSVPNATVTENGGWTYVDVKLEKTLGISQEGYSTVVREHNWIMGTHGLYRLISGKGVQQSFQELQKIVGDSAVLDANFAEPPKRSYSLILSSEEQELLAHLTCGDSNASSNNKRLTLLFNASDKIVERANGVISRYHAFLNRTRDTSTETVLGRPEPTVYSELLSTDPLTLDDLERRTSVGYDRRLTYVSGEIIQHPVFGLGLVGEIGRTTMRVYFPNERTQRTLNHPPRK